MQHNYLNLIIKLLNYIINLPLTSNRVQNRKLPYNFKSNSNSKNKSFRPSSSPKTSNNKTNKKIVIENNYCYWCDSYGHNTKNCTQLKDPPKKNSNKRRNNKSNKSNFSNNVNDSNEYSSDSNIQFEYNITNFSSNNITVTPLINEYTHENICNNTNCNEDNRWIIDSGTGINLAADKEHFNDLTKVEGHKITYANGTSYIINEKGNYEAKTSDGKLVISDVYYAPNKEQLNFYSLSTQY